MKSVRLLFEEGPGIGMGHRRRMEVLADALCRRGATAELIRLTDEPAVCKLDATVIDAYSIDADRGLCPGGVVVAVDDLRRELDVDLVVRPAPSSCAATESSPEVLEGFRFALIAVDIGGATRRPVAGDPVLVSFGGADSEGFGRAVADAIAAGGVRVVHAPGPWSERSARVDVGTIDAPRGLSAHLVGARIVVCAGGVTMLESLASGRATIVVPTAANQADGVAAVAEAGAAMVLPAGVSVTEVVDAVGALLVDDALAIAFGERARRLVDGLGAGRVAEAILARI